MIKVKTQRQFALPWGLTLDPSVWDTPKAVISLAISALCGTLLLAAMGTVAALVSRGDLPAPWVTFQVFWNLVSNPFYSNGPNDKGIGLQLLASFQRVSTGFALGTLVAIPLGILLGVSRPIRFLVDPIVQLLRPVSPLAWFPIGLATFHGAPSATIFVIFITSLWPTVINTAFGVSSLPQNYQDVARVFSFSRWKYLTRVVLPYCVPHLLTGMRLSMGIAWLVIVAAEMLSGGTGIGFFVWDSWNALSLERVMSAILLIGLVGLGIDRGFGLLIQRFSYQEAE